jgi:hypothetical protein
MSNIIDLRATKIAREKLTIAVAGLVATNCPHPTVDDVVTFAAEVRHWDERRPDIFYFEAVAATPHDAALVWAVELLGTIPGWRAALFGGRAHA